MQTKTQFAQFFKAEIEPTISATDKPALREAWNNTIDAMCKDGALPEHARDWSHPARFYWPNDRPAIKRKPYVRKTEDEYQIHGYYYGTWEEVTCETTKVEAKERLKEYRENEPGTSFYMVKKRVKIAN